ncbi:MAG: fibronectin type III domain-containing protein, partial [Gammaproteobacteria bacterium]
MSAGRKLARALCVALSIACAPAAMLAAPAAQAQFAGTPPTNPMLTAGTDTLDFSWTAAVSSDSEFPVSAYVVHLRELPTPFPSGFDRKNSLPSYAVASGIELTGRGELFAVGTMLNFANLKVGATYEARVRAFDTGGAVSAWTTPVQARPISPITAITLTAPSGATELQPAFAFAILTYRASVLPAVENITITVTFAETATAGVRGASAAALTSGSASGNIALSAGENIIDIIAMRGGETSTTTVTVTRATNAPLRPQGAELLVPVGGNLTLTWSMPTGDGGADITQYRVRWAESAAPDVYLGDGANRENGSIAPGAAGARTYTLTGLQKFTQYEAQVAAENRIGIGAWSAAQRGMRISGPSAPQSPSIGIAHGALELSWAAPANDGGSAISGYRVRWADASDAAAWINPAGASGEEVSGGADARLYTVTGLTNGRAYVAQVAARNAAGTGNWRISARETPVAAPGVPGDVRARDIAGRLMLTWSAPAADGGNAISGYAVRWAEGADSTTWVNPPGEDGQILATTATEYLLPNDITAGIIYAIQIAARNRGGTGAFSASARGVVANTVSMSATAEVIEGGTGETFLTINPQQISGVAPDRRLALSNTDVSAQNAVDHTSGGITFTLAGGMNFRRIGLGTLDDELVEFDEVFHVTIGKNDAADASYVIGAAATTVVTIIDDDRDSATIAFGTDAAATAAYTAAASETDGTLNVPVRISHAPSADITFLIRAVTTAAGAIEGRDYRIASKRVAFPAGADEAARTQNIVITLIDDTLAEVDEDIVLRILPADRVVNDLGDYYARGAAATARISISSDETPPPPVFTLQPGDGMLTLNWMPAGGSISGYRARWRLAATG